jgi:AcrR family transcriptional regulator
MKSIISTTQKIINTSVILFAKNSFAGTTLQEIARASDSSIGSIYHAFPNGKIDIINAIAKEYFALYREGLNEILSQDVVNMDLEEIIDHIIALQIELGEKYPCCYDPIFETENKGFISEVADIEKQLENQVVLIIQIKVPKLTREIAELRVKMCYHIWESILCEYGKTKDKEILEQLKIITLQYLKN